MAYIIDSSPDTSQLAPFSFPQEIIDMVIDNLEDETSSLKAAGLVGRTWCYRTREHLFRFVELHGGHQPKARCSQLNLLLEQRPILCKAIKNLVFAGNTAGHDTDFWLYAENPDAILDLIPLLTSLECLDIEVIGLNWGIVSPALRIALYELMAQPHLSCLKLATISNINIVPLAQCHNLNRIVLERVLSPPTACFPLNSPSALRYPPTENDRQRYLEVLDVRASGEAFETLFACAGTSEGTLNISRPRILWTGTASFSTAKMDRAWNTILTKCCSNVEIYYVIQDIELTAIDVDPFPDAVFAFQHFPKLTTLIVVFNYHCFALGQGQDAFSTFVQALNRLSQSGRPSQLTELSLSFDFERIDNIDEELDISELLYAFAIKDIWRELDETLAKGVFARLDKVSIAFDATSCTFSDEAWDRTEHGILDQMSFLHGKRKIVEITYDEVYEDTDTDTDTDTENGDSDAVENDSATVQTST